MGRTTYEEMAGFWPTCDDEYAAPMNDIPKVVFSKTLTSANWARSTIASGDLADEITALKREPGGDMIAWGGAAFAQSLSRLRLVDEYRLVVQPVALGDGLALFAGLSVPFVLTSSKPRHTPTARCSTSTSRLLCAEGAIMGSCQTTPFPGPRSLLGWPRRVTTGCAPHCRQAPRMRRRYGES